MSGCGFCVVTDKKTMDKERTYSFDEEAPPGDANSPKFIYSRSISAAVYLAHVRMIRLRVLSLTYRGWVASFYDIYEMK
jgi:hypothetical protein